MNGIYPGLIVIYVNCESWIGIHSTVVWQRNGAASECCNSLWRDIERSSSSSSSSWPWRLCKWTVTNSPSARRFQYFCLHASWGALEPFSLDLKQSNVPQFRLSSRISIASDNGYFWSCRFFCWRNSFNFQKIRHHSYSRGEHTAEQSTIVRHGCMEALGKRMQCSSQTDAIRRTEISSIENIRQRIVCTITA